MQISIIIISLQQVKSRRIILKKKGKVRESDNKLNKNMTTLEVK